MEENENLINQTQDIALNEGADEASDETRVYEIGYHLVSTIPEEEVAGEVAKIKTVIEKQGGTFISEGAPVLRNLAYYIAKKVKTTKTRYTKAYFGWLKFNVLPEGALAIKTALDQSDMILRYLMISTVKENTLYAEREKGDDDREDGEGKEIDEEKLDKSIENLVVS